VKGRWVEVPRGFIDFIPSAFPDLPFVAEDLGVITEDVNEARDRLGIPGMRVLQFGFDGSTNNMHHPGYHAKNSFVYTSTHDTNTVLGWFREEAKPKEKEEISNLVGHSVTEVNVCDDFVAMAMSSIADVAVVSMQDLLRLGRESRMNNPATTVGNWIWRMLPGELSEAKFRELGEMTSKSGRGQT
jgi:4-alpha-glucanotransferase